MLWILRYIANGEDYRTTEADVTDPITVRRLAFEIVEEMLCNGKLRAWFTNYPITDTYHLDPAHGSVGHILQRIKSEWDGLGREPSMCEMAAFSVPDRETTNKALTKPDREQASELSIDYSKQFQRAKRTKTVGHWSLFIFFFFYCANRREDLWMVNGLSWGHHMYSKPRSRNISLT